MTRICREDISHSFFLSFPPSLEHDFFHRPFHQQTPPLNHPSPPPPSPPPVDGIGANLVPRNTNTTTTQNSPSVDTLRPSAGTLAGDTSSGEGSSMDLPLTLFEDIDLGLLSCTESLGFESSDEISTLGFGSGAGFSCSTATSYSSNAEDHESSCSSSSSSSSSSSWTSPFCSTSYCSTSTRRWSEKREFPPPLTTMRGNGGRNFMLRSERKDGRLEIVKVEIERPEVLYASRQNGRLTMHLVRSFPEYDEEEEEEEEEDEEDDVVLEEEKEQQEVKEEEEEEEKAEDDESETEEEEEEVAEEEEEEEEEIEWKNIPAAAVRRCYQYHQQHAWGHHHQRRWVTTM